MIYVISDIHGELDLFKEMVKKIDLKEDDTMYILGDLIDRGKKSIETLLYTMNHPNMEFILGNHEDFMCSLYTGEDKLYSSWMRECNGGSITLAQYNELCGEQMDKIQIFLEEAPLYKLIEVNGRKFLLVHCGINALNEYDLDTAINMQTRRDILWIRDEFTNNPCRMDVTVVFGHTFTESLCNQHRIWFDFIEKDGRIHNDKIGIDCGSYESKKLGCLRLDDMKEFYVEESKF